MPSRAVVTVGKDAASTRSRERPQLDEVIDPILTRLDALPCGEPAQTHAELVAIVKELALEIKAVRRWGERRVDDGLDELDNRVALLTKAEAERSGREHGRRA